MLLEEPTTYISVYILSNPVN